MSIPDFHTYIDKIPRGIWLGGKETCTDQSFNVINPATNTVITSVCAASSDDALQALTIADTVTPHWAQTSPRQRSQILLQAYDLIMQRQDELAMIMTLELGRVLRESVNEVVYGAEFFRWFAQEALRIDGTVTYAPAGNGTIVVIHQPVGSCLAITPWNFPLAMGTRKIGPAIAAGCPIIVKPAEDTPLTMLWLARILAEAGLPEGVLSVLPTPHAAALTEPLIADPRLRKISFTGSTGVGKHLLRQSADHVLRTSMELGGNAPVIIWDDADLDVALEGTLAAKMRNGGQACTAANRIYVHKNIAVEFTEKFTEKVSHLTVGPGWETSSDIGAIINERQLHRIMNALTTATDQGATIVTGGNSTLAPGFFLEPTVLTHVHSGMDIAREEIFAPVASIIEFDDEEDVINQANSTPYGLAAYMFTQDFARITTMSKALQYGMVGINRGVISDPAAPFGGWKESGLGREGGHEGIREYLATKYIALP